MKRIVPARPKYIDEDRLNSAKSGETFSIDSGLGGSYTVEYLGFYEESYWFKFPPEVWDGEAFEVAPDQVSTTIYILVPVEEY